MKTPDRHPPIHRSSFIHRRTGRGLTLIEMLTTVAALVIILGLAVQLARLVRGRQAGHSTRELLARLDRAMTQYNDLQPALAAVPPLLDIPLSTYNDGDLQRRALLNNKAFVAAARRVTDGYLFKGLSFSMFDDLTLRDAWGTPVVYMPPGAENIGIAPQNRYFFLSAGPDRHFTTLVDNLYSYERPWEE
jgi:type II secretory pathway pseudopilin PulG